MSVSTFVEFKAKSLLLRDSNTSGIPEVSISPGVLSIYNGSNRINITPTTISNDAIIAITNVNLSGTATGVTMASTDNSSKLATTAFVKSQTFNLSGYAQTSVIQTWTAIQNFSTITASTPATSDNSSTVATTAFVKAQPAGLTLPIVLGTTGVLTTLGQSILYSTNGFNKTFNSTERCFAPSGYLAEGSYIAHITVYTGDATYTIAVFGLATSATQITDGQTTTGLDLGFGKEINNVNINNGVLSATVCTVLTITSSRPYLSPRIYLIGSGNTGGGWIQLKLTRLT
jgi:hypothetical protein